MRRVGTPIILAMTALVLTGCATMNVSSHVLRGADFTQYRTFEWGPADALPTGDPRLDRDPFFQDHVQGAVEKGLAGRGFARVSVGTPDLLIHYHANISRRIDINWLDRERGYCYDDACGVRTVEKEAGTLVLDVIDARTNRLVWRGWAQHSVKTCSATVIGWSKGSTTLSPGCWNNFQLAPASIERVPAHIGAQ